MKVWGLKIIKNDCHFIPSVISITAESKICSKSPLACVKSGKMIKMIFSGLRRYEPMKWLICDMLESYASLSLVPTNWVYFTYEQFFVWIHSCEFPLKWTEESWFAWVCTPRTLKKTCQIGSQLTFNLHLLLASWHNDCTNLQSFIYQQNESK